MRATILDHRGSPLLDLLPLAQLRLLWTVYFHPMETMREYSERLGVSQSTITQLTERLVRRGLLDRLPDAHDRRVIRLVVSPAAQQILGAADSRHREVVRSIWRSLDEQEQFLAVRVLQQLALAAEEYHIQTGSPLPALGDPNDPGATPSTSSETAGAQPVLDLLARRVRGSSGI
jgi:DNA-binding MarR family transcriptional regulator